MTFDMQSFYFIYKPTHKNFGGWIRVISYDWRSAMKEYTDIYGRDFLNFYEEEFIKKEYYPRGELKII